MLRAAMAIGLTLLLTAFVSSAPGDLPGTDGGPADRSCGVLGDVSPYGPVGVGATKVKCGNARRVARRSVKGEDVDGWQCTGVGTRFGHCHRKKKIAHWYAEH
jgi:hypothetical protein